jgi:pyruvate formate lyase activating enzyme
METEAMGDETIGKDFTVGDVLAAVEKDRPYYRRSGGGVTLSGGEVLCQPGFARDVLKAAKEAGIHTAVESTGLAEYVVISELLPYLDLFLLDIKHADPLKHERFTGKRNDKALENAKKITERVRLIVRVPVVPGFNASAEDIKAIAVLAKGFTKELHLLPYHRLGEGKYAALGRPYPMEGTQPPEAALMNELKTLVEKTGLTCRIGG